MLQQCSGVSDKTAEALLKSFGSFQAIIAASEKTLAETKISEKRKLGPVIAKKLRAVFYDCPESSS
jgi:ERCC4-type nuclease